MEALEPPITTPVGLIEELVQYIQAVSPGSKIIVGEGCGSTNYETDHVFHSLGYTEMASRTAKQQQQPKGQVLLPKL